MRWRISAAVKMRASNDFPFELRQAAHPHQMQTTGACATAISFAASAHWLMPYCSASQSIAPSSMVALLAT
jgi:hypothetical protein